MRMTVALPTISKFLSEKARCYSAEIAPATLTLVLLIFLRSAAALWLMLLPAKWALMIGLSPCEAALREWTRTVTSLARRMTL